MIEITDIDWTNHDFNTLVIFFNKRIEQKDKKIKQLEAELLLIPQNTQLKEIPEATT